MHRNALTTRDERKKPQVITFYSRTKGGVDVMDMMPRIHTTRFKSHKWIMNALAYMLDTVRTNIFTLWNEIHSNNKMGSFDISFLRIFKFVTKMLQGYNGVLLLL